MSKKTRIKICGITNLDDALMACHYGADAIGLIFYDKSPRAVNPAMAHTIRAHLPPFVSVVGLFVNPSATEVFKVLNAVALDCIQFHGDEPPELCQSIGRPYLKALHIDEEHNDSTLYHQYRDASGFVVDSKTAQHYGGTGVSFDWSLLNKHSIPHLCLAGGLTPENVKQALETVKPYAVDVCSGVEKSKGIKDPVKIKAFCEAVRGYEHHG